MTLEVIGEKMGGYSRLNDVTHKDLILGIDPGTIQTGYALLRSSPQLNVIDYGCVTPPKRMELAQRYRVLFEATQALIQSHHPNVMVIETQFVKDNVQSAMKLGMARGVIMLAATLAEIPVFEYAPARVKVAIVGHGRASKHQIQDMVKRLLSLSHIPEPADAADALAIALCHAFTESRRERCTII